MRIMDLEVLTKCEPNLMKRHFAKAAKWAYVVRKSNFCRPACVGYVCVWIGFEKAYSEGG